MRCLSFMRVLVVALLFVLFFSIRGTSEASHSWGNYHWARTANPFTLKLGDNLSSSWDQYLATTSADWSISSVLDTTVVSGGTSSRRCRATSGRVEVCNYRYGNNGWLGLAQIWVSGDHITKGLTKVNDTYFNTATYNTPAWKNLVMCQEVGHNVGLDHQDEDFNNPPLGTCMDYTSDPTPNQHPNSHDYEQLEIIYAHLDTFTTLNKSTGFSFWQPKQMTEFFEFFEGAFENPQDWGTKIRETTRSVVYERDFGFGLKLFTFVILSGL